MPVLKPDFVALDVGQTALRGIARIGSTDHQVSADVGAPAITDQHSIERYVEQIACALRDEYFAPGHLVLGTTGYPESASIRELLIDQLQTRIRPGMATVVSDSVSAFLGSVDGSSGVSLTWGAGIAALAIHEGEYVRVDGRGHALGDLGSGYWIGRRGLVEALNWLEGRGGSEQLASEATTRLGSPSEIYRRAYLSEATVRFVACFVPAVVEAAAAGDPIATSILSEATHHAVTTATSAARRVPGLAEKPTIGVCGALANADTLIDPFVEQVSAAFPSATIRVIPGAPLAGTISLAENPTLGNAFSGLVHSTVAKAGRLGPKFEIESLAGTVIVSCQASKDSPLAGPAHMASMAAAAQMGGASAIRANGPADVAAIKRRVTIPVVSLLKRQTPAGSLWITPTFADAQALSEAGADMIALDATLRRRDFAAQFNELIDDIHQRLGLPVLADVDNLEAALAAAAAGADAIATTLAGYTDSSTGYDESSPDIDLVREITTALDVPIVAEGRYQQRAHVADAFSAGATAVVVGAAVTDPIELTRRFVAASPSGTTP
ncbi:MAG: putative N-acetylmannosamine-6-phosphate 2-epimerase [bacterium]|nr:putative N-acetylmannosamine-6-phosphate 2-epimerase [bacterium]